MKLRRYAKEERRICNLSEVKEFEVFSPYYVDDTLFQNRYRCNCGTLYGMERKNILCEVCNTPVVYKDPESDNILVGCIQNASIMNSLCYRQLTLVEYINKPDSIIKNCALTRSLRDAFGIVSFKSDCISVEVVGIIE